MPRSLVKLWKDKGPLGEFEHRVRWYEGEFDIRLVYDTPVGISRVWYSIAKREEAQAAYDAFIAIHGGRAPVKPRGVEDLNPRQVGLRAVEDMRRLCRRGHEMPEGTTRCFVCHPA